MPDRAAPDWMDRTGFGVVGRFTLNQGEEVTAEIVDFKEEANELIVRPIPEVGSYKHLQEPTRSIAVDSVLSFDAVPRSSHAWPHSDPCRDRSSRLRIFLMSLIFLCMTVGSVPLFLLLTGRPYGLQQASVISYTLVVLFFTFATTGAGYSGKNVPGYKFTCPAVEPQIPRLLWRHLIFLTALLVLQTVMLTIHPNLPGWWNARDKKGLTPFDAGVFFACFSLAWVQILTNKSLLKRAHSEFSE